MSGALFPLFASMPASPPPEYAHLRHVPQTIVDQLNARSLTFLANSVELYGRAWMEYLKQGRGALFVRYDSVEDMEECATQNQYKMRYTELVDMLSVNYPPGHKLIKEYSPQNEFVLLVGLSCVNSLGGMVFAASLVPRNAQHRVNEAARVMEQYESQGGRDSPRLPPLSSRSRLRMCCTLRTALSMSQCNHDEND